MSHRGKNRVAARRAVLVVHLPEVIEVEHDQRHGHLAATRTPELGIDDLSRIRACGAPGEHVAQSELADVATDLRVFERDGKQRRGGGDQALAVGRWRAALELYAQDAERAAAHDEWKAHQLARGRRCRTAADQAFGKGLALDDLLLS